MERVLLVGKNKTIGPLSTYTSLAICLEGLLLCLRRDDILMYAWCHWRGTYSTLSNWMHKCGLPNNSYYQALRQTNITFTGNNTLCRCHFRPTLPNKSYIKENCQFTRDNTHFLTSKKKDSHMKIPYLKVVYSITRGKLQTLQYNELSN